MEKINFQLASIKEYQRRDVGTEVAKLIISIKSRLCLASAFFSHAPAALLKKKPIEEVQKEKEKK